MYEHLYSHKMIEDSTGIGISLVAILISVLIILYKYYRKPVRDDSQYVWVIGASSGIGKGICIECELLRAGDSICTEWKECDIEFSERREAC